MSQDCVARMFLRRRLKFFQSIQTSTKLKNTNTHKTVCAQRIPYLKYARTSSSTSCKRSTIALKLSHPATFLLCGPSFCGKTLWMFRFIENRNEIFTEKIEKVYYLYDTYQKKFDDYVNGIEFVHGVPTLEILKNAD